jgi:hypothetical protein
MSHSLNTAHIDEKMQILHSGTMLSHCIIYTTLCSSLSTCLDCSFKFLKPCSEILQVKQLQCLLDGAPSIMEMSASKSQPLAKHQDFGIEKTSEGIFRGPPICEDILMVKKRFIINDGGNSVDNLDCQYKVIGFRVRVSLATLALDFPPFFPSTSLSPFPCFLSSFCHISKLITF